jgi:tetratricopeptide (TPR) repeat protein
MTRHARKPAILALVGSILVAAGSLAATGQFRAPGSATSIDALERAIASGSADAATWNSYGDALRADNRFAHAAAAYQRALELDPDRPLARFNAALSLAQAREPDQFFAFFSHLTMNDPKQAVDLLDRPELAALHADPRWETAAGTARAQAAD